MITRTQPQRPKRPVVPTMPAAVLTGRGKIELREVPIPEPQAGEVRVQVEGCGVCASSLPVWEGRTWFDYPRSPGEPGHEGWGYIDAAGPGVTQFRPGDRVAFLSYRSFAAFDIAPASATLHLPDPLAAVPFPGEALACAMNAFARSRINSGEVVAIVGAGFLGMLFVALARGVGARVIAISRRAYAREMALRHGAEQAIALGNHQDVAASIQEFTGGQLCDCVVEACGLQESLDLASILLRTRGRLLIAGYHQDGMRSVNMQLWNWNGLDVINAHEREPSRYLQGMRQAVQAVSSGALDPSALYTHLLTLDRLESAFQLMKDRPAGFLKALIVMKST